MERMPIRSPLPLLKGESVHSQKIRRPAFVMLSRVMRSQDEPSSKPFHTNTMRPWFSAVTPRLERLLPRISSDPNPKILSAAGFQEETRNSGSHTMQAIGRASICSGTSLCRGATFLSSEFIIPIDDDGQEGHAV